MHAEVVDVYTKFEALAIVLGDSTERRADDIICFFFFQAEDGIRDYKVTGVQTCAPPICGLPLLLGTASPDVRRSGHVAPLRKLLARRGAEPGGAVLPPPRIRVRAVLPRPGGAIREPRGDLHRVRLFLLLFRQLAGPREGLRGHDRLAPRPVRDEPGHRAGKRSEEH